MNIKFWLQAFRLKTLPLALATILLGNFLARSLGDYSWTIAILTISTTIFLQILSNLANDYGDAVNGVDNEYRVGPARAVQSGLISTSLMKKGILVFVVLSFLSGVSLIYVSFKGFLNASFLLFLLLGVLAIFAAINYTMGKRPYGYAGLGDLFVLIFFGWTAVIGTTYLHDSQFSLDLLLPASAVGLFSVGVLNLNNMRDAVEDKKTGKHTLASRLGEDKSRLYHISLMAIALLCSIVYMAIHIMNTIQWMYLIFTIPIIFHARRVWWNKIPAHLDPELKKLALATLLFSTTYGLAILYPMIIENYN